MKKLEQQYQNRIKTLYDPDTYLEHGMNPALKDLQRMIGENSLEGIMPRYVTTIDTKPRRTSWWRDVTDIYDRELRCYNFLRSVPIWMFVTANFLLSVRYARSFLPVGKYGIRRIDQTHFYKHWGWLGVGAVCAMPAFGFSIWVKTTGYMLQKFYSHVIMQERNWFYEYNKFTNSRAGFEFEDAPFSDDEDPTNDYGAFAAAITPEYPDWFNAYNRTDRPLE